MTMRSILLMPLAMAIGLAVIGCGPRIDDEELGTIVYELPDVPGAEERVIVEPWPEAEAQQKDKGTAATRNR